MPDKRTHLFLGHTETLVRPNRSKYPTHPAGGFPALHDDSLAALAGPEFNVHNVPFHRRRDHVYVADAIDERESGKNKETRDWSRGTLPRHRLDF